MKILRQTIHSSPYAGVFCTLTEKIGLFPPELHSKETKNLSDNLGVEIIHTKIAESPLIGTIVVGNSNGFVAGEIATEKEIEHLNRLGVRIKKLSGITAIGNLLEANDSKGICSPVIKEKTRKEIEEFLKIELKTIKIAGSDLAGSCLVATNRGFVMNVNASEKEFLETKKFLKLEGTLSTANYGDAFIGNSLVANTKAAIAGIHTSGTELMRIDEGLSGE